MTDNIKEMLNDTHYEGDGEDPTELVFQVYATVTTPVGVFTGFVSADLPSFDEACQERDRIQNMLRDCDSFTFFSDQTPGSEFTMLHALINTSMFETNIVHSPKLA